MKHVPLVVQIGLVDLRKDDIALDESTTDDPHPMVLNIADGIATPKRTYVTEVDRETTDDR